MLSRILGTGCDGYVSLPRDSTWSVKVIPIDHFTDVHKGAHVWSLHVVNVNVQDSNLIAVQPLFVLALGLVLVLSH